MNAPAPSQRLGAKPENTSCAKVKRLRDGFEVAKASGKNQYRLMNIDKWEAKWRRRYEACLAETSAVEEASDTLEDAVMAFEQSEDELESAGTLARLFQGPDRWIWLGGILMLVIVVVLGAYFAFFAPVPGAAQLDVSGE